jgi:hypothetical protein
VRASREVGSLAEMRDVISRSSDVRRFEPRDAAPWAAAADRFQELTQ